LQRKKYRKKQRKKQQVARPKKTKDKQKTASKKDPLALSHENLLCYTIRTQGAITLTVRNTVLVLFLTVFLLLLVFRT